MLPNLIAVTVIATGLVGAYLAPRQLTTSVLGLMLMLPSMVFMLGLSFGAEGRYLNFIVAFGLASITVFTYRVAVGTMAVTTPDLLWAGYAFWTFLTSLYVSGSVLSLSYVAHFIRSLLVPGCFFFAGRMYFSHSSAVRRLHLLMTVAISYSLLFTLVEYALRYNVYIDMNNWLIDLFQSSFERYLPDAHYAEWGFYRYLGPMTESTETAMVFLMGVAILLAMHEHVTGRRRTLDTILVWSSCALIVLGSTRGVMLATALLLLVSFVSAKTVRAVLFSLGAALIGVWWFFREAIIASAFFNARIARVDTIITRLAAYLAAIQIVLSSPLLGVGIGTPIYIVSALEAGGDEFTTHSFYLDNLVRTGLCGTVLLLFLHGTIIRTAFRLLQVRKGEAEAYLARAYLFLVLGMGLVYLFNPEKRLTSAVIWFMGGGVVSFYARFKTASLPNKATAEPESVLSPV